MQLARVILCASIVCLVSNGYAAETLLLPKALKDSKVGDWVEYRFAVTINDGLTTVSSVRSTITEKHADKVVVQSSKLDQDGKPAHFTTSESRLNALAPFADTTNTREQGKKSVVVGGRTLDASFVTVADTGYMQLTTTAVYSAAVPLDGVVSIHSKTKNFTSEQILTAFGTAETPAKP